MVFTDTDRTAAISASVTAGMRVIATDAKDAGPVGWSTPSFQTVTPFPAGDGGVERVVRDAHANGMFVVARFDVFQDSVAAAAFPGSRIAGSEWVDPACADVRAYALSQVKDLVTRTGIDELNFDHVRYPEPEDLAAGASGALPCTGSTIGDVAHANRSSVITSWVADAVAAAHAIRPTLRTSASVFAGSMIAPLAYIGQDGARLAYTVDVLRPMLYPTYFSATAESQPYQTAYDYTASGVSHFGAAKIQPWVEGFGPYSARADIIGQELKGVVDAGGTGALVWWFWSAGTSPAFWSSVASAIPAPDPAPAPAPAPSPSPTPSPTFNATFMWSATTNGRMGVVVTGAPIASVSAKINAQPAVALALRKGIWTRQTYVAPGSSVVFVATSTTGAAAVSAAMIWR